MSNTNSLEYDYIIVGGGSAGCVLANRLSADPSLRVCLLEAGPTDKNPMIHIPIGILWMMRSKVLNWNYFTESEPQLANRRLFWPRGRTLGGSSSSNAMIYIRGHQSDYDHWASLGNAGWSFADLLPYFKKSQNQERGADAWHGVGGPLNVADLRNKNNTSHTFLRAAVEAGFVANPDFNGASQEGVGFYQVTQKNGQRCSAAVAYLKPIRGRSNLDIITEAHAARVLLEGKRAVGMEYIRKGQTLSIRAKREVILSCGAITSPQVLMLSGIGEASALQAVGITPVHELAGVGKNLQDHLDVCIVHRGRNAKSYGLTPINMLLGLPNALKYLFARRGDLTTNAAEAGGFVKGANTAAVAPEYQFHLTAAPLDKHGLNTQYMLTDGYTLHVCPLRPKSRGDIRLADKNPLSKPKIFANYLSHPDDMQNMIEATRIGVRVLNARAFDGIRHSPMSAPTSDDEGAIIDFIRRKAETIYHPVGTCKMGPASDSSAVVDSHLRVHGITGLRVVDASIMPTLIGGNTNGPTIAIAERASDLILGKI